MSGEFAKKLYSSKRWQETRRAYGASKGWLCERCLSRGIYKPGEIVHHKTHLTADNINDADIALSFNNLELLCRDCHAEEHSTGGRRGYKFDKQGNIIRTGSKTHGND